MGVPFKRSRAPRSDQSVPSDPMPQSMSTGHDESRERGTNSQMPLNPTPYPSAAAGGPMPNSVKGPRSAASDPAPTSDGAVRGHYQGASGYPKRKPRQK